MEQNKTFSDPGLRITMIDALRGFSLLGIIIVHMLQHYGIFSFPPMGQEGEAPQFSQWDAAIQWLSQNVIMGKFINIFAFLFGLSFFIQMDRAAQKGTDFRKRFLWRMVILFVIGIIGNCFYTGDILSIYAVFGILMVLLYRFKNKILMIIVALLLFGVPRVFISVFEKMVKTEQVEGNQNGQGPGGPGAPGQMPADTLAATIPPPAANVGDSASTQVTPPPPAPAPAPKPQAAASTTARPAGNTAVAVSSNRSGGGQRGNRQGGGQVAVVRSIAPGGQAGGGGGNRQRGNRQGAGQATRPAGNNAAPQPGNRPAAGDSVRHRPNIPMDTTEAGREARRARRHAMDSIRFEHGDSLRFAHGFPNDSIAHDSMRGDWKDGNPEGGMEGRGGFPGFEMEKPSFFKSAYNNLTSGFVRKLNYQFGTFGRGYITFALFILGLVIGRSRFFEEAQTRKGRNIVIFAGFVLSLFALKYITGLFTQQPPMMPGGGAPSFMAFAMDNIYTVLFSGALAMGFIVLYQAKGIGKCLDVLTPYGRMGLTNYEMQSVIGSIIFSMWGFGAIFGAWSASQLFLLGLAIYAIQIIISKYWLKYFLYGPFEWLWRSATYLKIQPFKK